MGGQHWYSPGADSNLVLRKAHLMVLRMAPWSDSVQFFL